MRELLHVKGKVLLPIYKTNTRKNTAEPPT